MRAPRPGLAAPLWIYRLALPQLTCRPGASNIGPSRTGDATCLLIRIRANDVEVEARVEILLGHDGLLNSSDLDVEVGDLIEPFRNATIAVVSRPLLGRVPSRHIVHFVHFRFRDLGIVLA